MNEKIEQLAQAKRFCCTQCRGAHPRARRNARISLYEHLAPAVLLTARQLDSEAMPPPALKDRLLRQLTAQPQPSRLHRFLHIHPVPAWQAAAAVLLGFSLVALRPTEKVIEHTQTVWQTRTDTVYSEKTQWRERVVWKEKVVFQTSPPVADTLLEKLDNQYVVPNFEAYDMSNQAVGTSLGDTPELMDFFTQGDQ